MNPGLQSAQGRAHAHLSVMLRASVKEKEKKRKIWSHAEAKYRQRFYVSGGESFHQHINTFAHTRAQRVTQTSQRMSSELN